MGCDVIRKDKGLAAAGGSPRKPEIREMHKSPLLRYFKPNLCQLKDQTRPSKSLKELRPNRQIRWVKQKTRDTTQYKIVIIYIFKKKKN